MTEAHSNPDLVAFHRQSELEASQRAYQEQKDAAAFPQDAPIATQPADASPVVAVPTPPPDPAATLMSLRLSLVMVIVLGLLLIVLRQRQARIRNERRT